MCHYRNGLEMASNEAEEPYGYPWVYSYPGGESPCLKTLPWSTRSYQHHPCPPRSPSEGTAGSVPEATRDAEGDVDGLRLRWNLEDGISCPSSPLDIALDSTLGSNIHGDVP